MAAPKPARYDIAAIQLVSQFVGHVTGVGAAGAAGAGKQNWALVWHLVYRIYLEEGLQVRTKTHRRRKSCQARGERPAAIKTNECWSMDFMADQLFDGRRFRLLTIVDNFSRESLAIRVGQRLTGDDERNGNMRGTSGHISWNVWLDGHWRQMAIVQGEGLDQSEMPWESWSAGSHPGRLRFQSFRPGHDEPLTDALIGQGKMSLGGGGYGGEGLPFPAHALDLWGGNLVEHSVPAPLAPLVLKDDGSGRHEYTIVAISSSGERTEPSTPVTANGYATLRWDRVAGGDSYIVHRDGVEIAGPLRIEGTHKVWEDEARR